MCETCRKLLSEGLNLCVRARDMDSRDRRAANLAISSNPDDWQRSGMFDEFVARHNATKDHQHAPIHTKSATIPVWLQDQYEKDLFDWEKRALAHLLQCDASEFSTANIGATP